MALTFVGVGTVSTGANPTVTLPSGTVPGTLLIMVVSSQNILSSSSVPGYTALTTSGLTTYMYVGYKIAGPNEASVTVTNASTATVAVLLAYSGGGIITPDVFAVTVGSSGTTATTNSITSTQQNNLIISCYSINNSTTTFLSAPAGTTLRLTTPSISGATNGLLIVDEIQAPTGINTTRSVTFGTSQPWDTSVVAFNQHTTPIVTWTGL